MIPPSAYVVIDAIIDSVKRSEFPSLIFAFVCSTFIEYSFVSPSFAIRSQSGEKIRDDWSARREISINAREIVRKPEWSHVHQCPALSEGADKKTWTKKPFGLLINTNDSISVSSVETILHSILVRRKHQPINQSVFAMVYFSQASMILTVPCLPITSSWRKLPKAAWIFPLWLQAVILVDQLNSKTVAGIKAAGTISLQGPSAVILEGGGYLFIVDRGRHRDIGSEPGGYCELTSSGTTRRKIVSKSFGAVDKYGFSIDVSPQQIKRVPKVFGFSSWTMRWTWEVIQPETGHQSAYDAMYSSLEMTKKKVSNGEKCMFFMYALLRILYSYSNYGGPDERDRRKRQTVNGECNRVNALRINLSKVWRMYDDVLRLRNEEKNRRVSSSTLMFQWSNFDSVSFDRITSAFVDERERVSVWMSNCNRSKGQDDRGLTRDGKNHQHSLNLFAVTLVAVATNRDHWDNRFA